MKLSDIELAQYLNAKFCHELAGSLGAIDNGVEFISMGNEQMQKKALDLIKISTQQTIKRLLFYRQAFGSSKTKGDADLSELKQNLINFLEGTKTSLKFVNEGDNPIYQTSSKIIYNLFVVALSHLIYGGQIEIHYKKIGDERQIKFILTSEENVKKDQEKEDILKGKYENIVFSTSNIQYYYTRRLIESISNNVEIHYESHSMIYIIRGKDA